MSAELILEGVRMVALCEAEDSHVATVVYEGVTSAGEGKLSAKVVIRTSVEPVQSSASRATW